MKKLFTLAIMALCTLTSNAQLKVDSLGKVGIGVSSSTDLNSALCVGGAGDNSYKVSVTNSNGGILKMETPASSNTSYGVYANIKSNKTTMTGLYVNAQGKYNGTAYGIKGVASGNKSIGVYGGLSGSSPLGAGIVGTTGSGSVSFLGGPYAGYFQGNVYVSGTTFAQVFTPVSDTIPHILMNSANYGATERVTDKLQNLSLIRYELPSDDKSEKPVSVSADIEATEEIANQPIQAEVPSTCYGLDPRQLKEAYPELVYEDSEGRYSINYIEMVPLLVQSIKELSAKVMTLEAELGIQDPTKPVLKSKQQTSGVEDTEVEMVSMSQNRPNPFSDSSVVTLSIPESAKSANILLYDMSGKQVQSIAVPERGQTNITVYASSLRPGMFIYNLIVDGKVRASRKMIVTE